MPKVEISSKGLLQTTGNGLQIDLPVTLNSKGVAGVAYSATTTLTRNGAGTMGAITVSLPPGALITDVGMVVTTAFLLNTAADVTVKVGDGAGQADICAAANFIGNNTGLAIGEAISTSGANGEGAAALAFAASAPMYADAASTIHFTVANSGNNVETGAGVCFVSYVVV